MKTKRLKPTTIIPDDLYVPRYADRQLESLLEDMGRPPYILVARQMGKTNLLLHARRNLAKTDDLFVYADLSNTFPTIREFFRYIIDLAFISLGTKGIALQQEISLTRKETAELPAHREHENELIKLLAIISGRLVICLDEIDALTKTDYSDNVFSQIRSTYFSGRVNYPNFSRLTYVLSGVAEPTEIIKEKNISPFNIGEKVYLYDFSFEECRTFITLANLSLTPNVIDRVYWWGAGNPRITWDICSAVEDKLILGENVVEADIDSIVKRLYLTTYDLAPVDHIRKLVEDDPAVRKAVLTLKTNKNASLGDAMISKLYLAGITNPSAADSEPCIKNKVIDQCLSLTWLRELEVRSLTVVERADKAVVEEQYEEALNLFENYLAEVVEPPPEKARFIYHSMATCALHLRQYQKCIEFVSKSPFIEAESGQLYLQQKFYLGSAYTGIGKYADAEEILGQVLDHKHAITFASTYLNAANNLMVAYLNGSPPKRDKLFEISERAIKETDSWGSEKKNDAGVREILSTIYLHRACAHIQLKARSAAEGDFSLALSFATPHARIGAHIAYAQSIADLEYRREILSFALDLIHVSGITSTQRDSMFPSQTLRATYTWLLRAIADFIPNRIEELLDAVIKAFGNRPSDIWQMVVPAAFEEPQDRGDGRATLLGAAIKKDVPGIEPTDYRWIVFFSLMETPFKDARQLESVYVERFWQVADAFFADFDFRILYGLVIGYLEVKNLARAMALLKIATPLIKEYEDRSASDVNGDLNLGQGNSVENAKAGRVILAYLNLMFEVLAGTPPVVIRKHAGDVIKTISSDLKPPVHFPEDTFSHFKQTLVALVGKSIEAPQSPVKAPNKPGRNDIVQVKYLPDGHIEQGKYKKFERHIEEGRYELILPLPKAGKTSGK
ncbi:MAG TPA: AAA-like domain-containing protein [Chthoniobacterales bacterium]